ncbi:DUF6707 family protein [Paenarthrobacter sp. NPDC089675]|uniref:DUF6707 family protein n=1 Tax=Paenarthrobacter sp. NPDC089675 TaxID=3364376 RepID=UPI00380F6FD1
MTHSPASQQYREKQAGDLQPGDFVYLPGDGPAEEIASVEVQDDDYGVPALLLVATHDGGSVRIAVGSSVPVGDGVPRGPGGDGGTGSSTPAEAEDDAPAEPAVVVPPRPATPPAHTGPTPEELALIPEPDGTPESVVRNAVAGHQGKKAVQALAERLAKGINTKSGSCLRDLSDLAFDLCITLKDPDRSLEVADLLNVLPFDGNLDRWASIERALSLSSFICRETGQTERAAVYEKLLRAPESQEDDPFKALVNARVRQRALNEPNLYDKEIFRAIDNGNQEAEREWRLLRLEALLFLRAHGGSKTIAEDELGRRIAGELEAVRA